MILKIKNILLKTFTILFLLAFFYISYISIFVGPNRFHKKSSIISLIISACVLIFLYIMYNFFKKLNSKQLKIIAVISFGTILLLQLLFIYFCRVIPSWDFGIVNDTAQKFALGELNSLPGYYYDLYPNNIALVFLLTSLFKFVSIFSVSKNAFLVSGYLFNILIINLSILILYKLIYTMYDQKMATLCAVFSVIVTPFYSYSQIFYTDTISMIFPILIFYLLYMYNNSNSKYKFIYLLSLGVVSAIGTVLKANVIIAFIAIVIYLIFSCNIKEILNKLSIIIIPFIIVVMMYKSTVSMYMPIEYKDAGLPYTHWIMMGMNYEGGFNDEDVAFSSDIKLSQGKEAAKEANLLEIKNRLNNFGLRGYMSFLNKKIAYTWGDGTYFALRKLSNYPATVNSVQPYITGNKNSVFLYTSISSHIIIIISILLSGISLFKRKIDLNHCINICIFGVFLFLILWETRSRYLVCYLPILILSSMNGLDYIFNKLKKDNNKILSN